MSNQSNQPWIPTPGEFILAELSPHLRSVCQVVQRFKSPDGSVKLLISTGYTNCKIPLKLCSPLRDPPMRFDPQFVETIDRLWQVAPPTG